MQRYNTGKKNDNKKFQNHFYSEIFGILTGYHHQQNDLHDVKFMHKTFTKTIEKYLHDKYRDMDNHD